MLYEQRLHYMDNLRALAMMAGIFFHAALAYSPFSYWVFPTADTQQSAFADVFAWFSHLFRMPLFFVVAGFFAALMVNKRGIGSLLKNRLLRIFLPFVVFWPIVDNVMTMEIMSSVETVRNPSPFLKYIATMNDQEAPITSTFPTTGHLWFLYYLVFFYILVWVAHSLELGKLAEWIGGFKPLTIMVGLPLLLVPALLSVSAPHPAPESFVPQLWSFGFYGLYFAFGYILFKNAGLLDRIKPYCSWLLALSFALYGIFFIVLPDNPFLQELEWKQKTVVAVLEAYIGVWMTLSCLIVGKSVFNRRSAILRYIADASYWVYIIHLPILFAIQFRLMDYELGILTEFLMSSFGTLAVGFTTYVLLVRWTPIGILLNGRRKALFSDKSEVIPAAA